MEPNRCFATACPELTRVVSGRSDDMTPDNGPLQVFPGTHRGRVFSHHHPTRGFFCGGFRIEDTELAGKVPLKLTGPAGSLSFHHARSVHGSDWNTSGTDRRVVFLEVAAADAWPLTNALLHTVDIASLQVMMLCGSYSGQVRMESCPIRLPLPASPVQGTLYQVSTLADVSACAE